MRFFALFLFIFAASLSVVSQDGVGAVAQNKPASEEKAAADTDQESFDKAIALLDPFQRIEALKTFIADYGESNLKMRALESLASARAAAGDTKLRAKESAEAIRLFKLAVEEAPEPISDDLFSKVLVNIPLNLFVLEQRDPAFEIANLLESKSASNSRHLLRLATFYFSIKYATGARRLAEQARDITPEDPLVYKSLGAAYRLGFDLASAHEAFTKALELEPNSLSNRQNLADLNRALGNPVAAEAQLREILAEQPEDIEAKTSLVLCLFDQGKREEAERSMSEALVENSSNAFLRIGAAHWYASNGEPDLAITNAQEALKFDQKAVWAYIVLGRAFMKKGDPVSAERSLLAAARLSASPTVAYELALARLDSGFYRDAGDIIKTFFTIENGQLVTDLDGRIGVEADNFADLISLERKSVLFTPVDGYEKASDEQLKALLAFDTALTDQNSTAEQLSETANAFIGEGDSMRTHRRLFVAEELLSAGKSPEEAGKLAREAVAGVEESLEVPNPAAAVMADQLYQGRKAAAANGELVLVPKVEKSTLLRIMRGRIEEIAARSVLATGDLPGAQIRLKRAIAVLPRDSAWWRSSTWRLGSVYEQIGDDRNALSNYATSYSSGDETVEKRNVLEAVYRRVYGSLTGIEEFLAKKEKDETDPAARFTKAPDEKITSEVGNETSAANTEPAADVRTETVADGAILKVLDGTVPTGQENVPADTIAKVSLPEDLDLTIAAPSETAAPRPGENDEVGDSNETGKSERLPETPVVPVAESAVAELPADQPAAAERPIGETIVINTPAIRPAVDDKTVEESPVADTPVDQPAVDGKTIEESPVADTPVGQPAVDDKTIEESVVIEPPADKPAVDDKTVEESAVIDTPVDQPAVGDKTLEESAVIDTPVDQPTVDDKTIEESAVIDTPVDQPAVDDKTVEESPVADTLVGQPVADDKTVEESTVIDTPADKPAVDDKTVVDDLTGKIPAATENSDDSSSEMSTQVDQPDLKPETIEKSSEEGTEPRSEPEIDNDLRAAELIDLGATRPRFVEADKIRAKPDGCGMILSQESVSIIANGGSFGIVVGVSNYQKAYVLRAKSNSPDDVSITFEPEIGSVEGRAFFVIKSVSDRTGVFTVSFETPCGNATVRVEVH